MSDHTFTEDEIRLLASLEEEGLLSRGTVRRIRTAVDAANVIGKRKTLFVLGCVQILLTCCLISGGIAAPFDWLKGLCYSLMVVFGIGGFFTVLTAVAGKK